MGKKDAAAAAEGSSTEAAAASTDPNDRVDIEARDGSGKVVGQFQIAEGDDKPVPVRASVDAPRGDSQPAKDKQRTATAELVADTFNGLHARLAHVERLIGVEHDSHQSDTIVRAERGDLTPE